MKIYELMQPAKVSKVMPNQSAEIDHGDGTKTVVDLKKNPQAISKDPTTGKLKLSKQPTKPGQADKATIKPGDEVEIDDKTI